jgi:hypothetical protein
MRFLSMLSTAFICAASVTHAAPDDFSFFGMQVMSTTERKCSHATKDANEASVTCTMIVTKIVVTAVACGGAAHQAGVIAGDLIDSVAGFDVDQDMTQAKYQEFLKPPTGASSLRMRFERGSRRPPFRYEVRELNADPAFKPKDFRCGDGSI